MHDLSRLSIIASVKIDSSDRLRNIRLFLQYFRTFFCNYEIILVEQGSEPTVLKQELAEQHEVIHHFLETDNCHHKTRNLNLAASISSRQCILMCDVDVLLPPEAIMGGLARISEGARFVYPYNGVMVQIKRHLVAENMNLHALRERLPFFPKHHDLLQNKLDFADFEPLYGGLRYDSTGGAIMFQRLPFFSIGGFNENIISYGFEDVELDQRIRTLDGPVQRLASFNCYHLEHARTTDSYYNNFYRSNEREYAKISLMDADELKRYVGGGLKHIRLDTGMDLALNNSESEYSLHLSKPARMDLSQLAIVMAVRHRTKTVISNFSALLKYLETKFDGYQLFIVEVGSRKFKYLDNKKNIQYFWLPALTSLEEAGAYAMELSDRRFVDSYQFDNDIDVSPIFRKYELLLNGGDLDSSFQQRIAPAMTAGKPLMAVIP